MQGETRDAASRETTRPVLALAVAAALTAWLPMVFGFFTSALFNWVLERGEFHTETLWDWWLWGLRAIVGPAFVLAWALLLGALFTVARRLLALWGPTARLGTRLAARARQWPRPAAFDNPVTPSSLLLLASSGALAIAWSYFWPLMTALGTPVASQPLERLVLLSPAYADHQQWYRIVFSWLVVLMVLAWYGVLRVAARQRHTLHRGVLAGGLAAVGLALLSLDLPYRLLVHNKFQAVAWNGRQCYVIGERAEDRLLFCPDLPPPRNRVVARSPETVQRLGRLESLFTPVPALVDARIDGASGE